MDSMIQITPGLNVAYEKFECFNQTTNLYVFPQELINYYNN